jgi:putative drug exporter of the RND superfamily
VKFRGLALLGWLGRVAARRPRLVVGAWVVMIVLLAGRGANLGHELGSHAPLIPGSSVERAHKIAVREFGNDYGIVVLLRGPDAAVETQGRTLARRLSSMPGVLVLSPWGGGNAAVDSLSPRPGVAGLLVRVSGGRNDEISGLVPPIQSRIDQTVRSPVTVSLAGAPVLLESAREASAETSAIGDLIAVPVLLFVLLFVFRSVLAALAPMVVGGAVVAATRGIVALLDGVVQFDSFVIGMVGMMGLALGVDYSLLVVSRFREEREKRDPAAAVEATVAAVSRSILPAGSALILAMSLALLALPSPLIQSSAVAIITATALSMLSAICVVPALLLLLGKNLDRWVLPSRGVSGGALSGWSRRVLRRPGFAVAAMFGILLLAGFAFNLDSGFGSIRMLPPKNSGRLQQEAVEKALGPGWGAPMEVLVDGRGSPVTSSHRLNAIAAFQREVEDDPGVASMTGLRPIARSVRKLPGIERQLVEQERGLDRLESGIAKVGKGASLTSDGLARAADGGRQLDSGLGATAEGAGALAGGLRKVSTGSGQLTTGLGRVSEGSGKLAEGTTKASTGVGRLADALGKAANETGEIQGSARLFKNAMDSGNAQLGELREPLQATETQLANALANLRRMSAGRSDPEYSATLGAVEEAIRQLSGTDPGSGEPANPPYAGVAAGVGRAEGEFEVGLYLASQLAKNGGKASSGIGKLARSSERIDRGLRRLATASNQVSDGVAALSRNGQRLSPALIQLSRGAEHLSGGLGMLGAGASRLAGGLGESATKSTALPRALRRIGNGLAGGNGSGGGSQLGELQKRSPGLFRSAYFVMASLDGSPPARRTQLGSLINLNRGGNDARLLIIPHDSPSTVEARETVERLDADAENLERKTDTEVVVGGVASASIELNRLIRDQAPLIRILLSLTSLLILIPLLRSLTIPIIAALINLATVSASFGVLSLLFNDSLFGGPGYIEAGIIPAAIIVMFALAIDYEVFFFARIREEYLRTGSTEAAIRNGLDRTGPVVSGAALIMIVIFLAFSLTEMMAIRNFAVAQAVGIFIDAFIVRLIVMPAIMLRLGKWCWWCPRWLDRLLPGGSSSAENRADALAHSGS